MNRLSKVLAAGMGCASASTAVAEDPVMVSPAWAVAACSAWNRDDVLTRGLMEFG